MKIKQQPSPVLFPLPTVLVTSVSKDGIINVATIAWTGVLCSEPPMVGIGVRPSRHTYKYLQETMEFVINIPQADYLQQTDQCGIISGEKEDKFSLTGFTAEQADIVKAPLIKECPVNVECVVKQILPLGTHDFFVAEVVAVHVDDSILDENGRIDSLKANPIAYLASGYNSLKEQIGRYGFSKK